MTNNSKHLNETKQFRLKFQIIFNIINLQKFAIIIGNLAEWLRRKIRNLLGSARAGSNPAVVVTFSYLYMERSRVRRIRSEAVFYVELSPSVYLLCPMNCQTVNIYHSLTIN